MTTQIALLRAVNVGGRKPIAMAALRNLVAGLGFTDVRSLLASGNLVFGGAAPTGAALEQLLEDEAERRLALRTDFIVRTAEEWMTIVARNPFGAEAARDPGHLVVMFFKAAPERAGVETLQRAITGPEMVHAEGRQAYIVYPEGIGRSRLTNALIERKLATRGTGRNWNTVERLAALAGGG